MELLKYLMYELLYMKVWSIFLFRDWLNGKTTQAKRTLFQCELRVPGGIFLTSIKLKLKNILNIQIFYFSFSAHYSIYGKMMLLTKNDSSHPQGLDPKYRMSKIDPVTEGLHNRPRWSVMIPTYNRTSILSETLHKCAWRQDLGPDAMQIETRPSVSGKRYREAKLTTLAARNRVSFYRQPHIGPVTLHSYIQRVNGRGSILHDDDVVLPGFCNRLQQAFLKTSPIGAFCRRAYVDDQIVSSTYRC